MTKWIENYLETIILGNPQTFKRVAVFPLSGANGEGRRHLTASEAFQAGALAVTEVNTGGSVPELKVINSGEQAVLLIDGEEVVGAKQNRVLNTTILIPPNSTVVIPVSCTEAGRWNYTSPHFTDSDVVMAQKARVKKLRSVSQSLDHSGNYASNQGQVWEDISALHQDLETNSPTAAMKDAFSAKSESIDECLAAFELQPKQRGILVVVDGIVVGFDVFSNADLYSQVHSKLIKSYVIETLYGAKKVTAEKSGGERAKLFLKSAATCDESKFKSVGLGFDYRFRGTDLVGSALVHEEESVHTAFFRSEGAEDESLVAGFRRRSGYRR
jgi:hypothetical protein